MFIGESSNQPLDMDNVHEYEYTDHDVNVRKKQFDYVQSFMCEFESKTKQFKMKNSDKNELYQLCIKLIETTSNLSTQLIADNVDPIFAIEASKSFACSQLNKLSTEYKRKKDYANNPQYVAPVEKAVGLRTEMMYDKNLQKKVPRIIQSTFQYIPILETLRILFSDENFKKTYFEYNASHDCTQGTFERFCCGSIFQNSNLFQANRFSIQIQLATDDVELCNALGSKSGLHKLCAVYMVVKNMPREFKSKLQNIQLVVAANPDDLKTRTTDFNNIWEQIVDELNELETVGIDVGTDEFLKGSLAVVTHDNLGGNVSLGFAQGFNTTYYCRTCMLEKEMCQKTTIEVADKIRSKKSYDHDIQVIANSNKVDYKKTRGVLQYCKLNELRNYHVCENFSCDCMHDLNEGIIPFCLHQFFSYCITKGVFSEKQLKEAIKYYDYGPIFSQSIPSDIKLEKTNLNQNASQSKCLLLNLPFILFKYRKNKELSKVWICVQSLLDIFHIVYSTKITESYLKRLSGCVKKHLKSIQKYFKVNLIPKHHFMVHYETIIRRIGPISDVAMFHYEAKHKILKGFSKNTNNFKNINKTIATRHQEVMCSKKYCGDDTVCAKKRNVKSDWLNEHLNFFDGPHEIKEVKYFSINTINYRSGLIISYNRCLYEIEKILCDGLNVLLFSIKLKCSGFDKYSRSLAAKKSDPIEKESINVHLLEHKRVYSKKMINENILVIIDNLDLEFR